MVPDDDQSSKVCALVGVSGWVAGERFLLKDGDDLVVGRSRSCDISLRRISAYTQRAREERDADHDFNTVSRKHLRVQQLGDYVRIEDMSTNGTFLDDEIMSEPIEINPASDQVQIRLGTRECFQIALVDASELDAEGPATVPDDGDNPFDEAEEISTQE